LVFIGSHSSQASDALCYMAFSASLKKRGFINCIAVVPARTLF
jgi:hypothetical protein